MRLAASIPSRCGIRTSSRARSGCVSRASSIASSPSLASAHTVKSLRSRIAPKSRRMIVSSSAIRIFIARLPSVENSRRQRRLIWKLADRAADAAHRLCDALLILDEREADEALAVGAEAAAGTDGDMRLPQQAERKRLRGLIGRDACPDEHRRLWPRDLPACACEPVAQRVAPPLVHGCGVRGLVARLAQRDGGGDLQRLEAPVVEG